MLCKIGTLLAPNSSLAQGDRQYLADQLVAAVSSYSLAKALTLEGLSVGSTTIKVHRMQVCACYRHA